jgi:glycosyltransferase involved in cell wall biosynthesis
MDSLKTCILIPFHDSDHVLVNCLDKLLETAPPDTALLLVDDASRRYPEGLEQRLADERVTVLKHRTCRGPGAARNTGIAWCYRHACAMVILLDSDCVPREDLVEGHRKLYRRYPDARCIGGGIEASGGGFWARLDGVASWFTSIPQLPERKVRGMYHVPTTNLSLRLDKINLQLPFFEERLRTGEDIHFFNRLHEVNGEIRFSPRPVVTHMDRDCRCDFLAHQYRWGLHTFAARGDLDTHPLIRVLLGLAFIPLIPLYALATASIVLMPWIRVRPATLRYFVPLLVVCAWKGVAVVEGIFWPRRALRDMNDPCAEPGYDASPQSS